jgi:hypothetical protein
MIPTSIYQKLDVMFFLSENKLLGDLLRQLASQIGAAFPAYPHQK